MGSGLGHYLSWQFLWPKIRPSLFSFSTPKTVTIIDWRLGISLRALQGTILAYVLWNLIQKQAFLLQETPLGLVSPYTSGRTNGTEDVYRNLQDDFYAGAAAAAAARGRGVAAGFAPFQHCVNASYDFQLDEATAFRAVPCVFLDKGEATVRISNGILVVTSFENKLTRTKPAPAAATAASCAALLNCTARAGRAEYRLGRCYCIVNRPYFTVGAENMVLAFNHLFYTDSVEGSAPETRVRLDGSTKDLLIIPRGNVVSFPVSEWLALAGVDLDGTYNQSGLFPTGPVPRVRLAGVQLLIKLQYYNYNQWPGAKKKIDNSKAPPVCILSIRPKFIWTSLGNDVNYKTLPDYLDSSAGGGYDYDNRVRYGVQFTFQASGFYGHFNPGSFITALVAGSVMIKIAHTVVQLAAFYLLGLASQLYTDFAKEPVVFEKEYARFATRALAAMVAFRALDRNSSGAVTKQELATLLEDLDERLSKKQVELLANLMVTCVETLDKKGQKKAVEGDGKIELSEFVDLFTGEKSSVEGLLRMTQELHKREDEKEAEALKRAAGEPSRRRSTRGSGEGEGNGWHLGFGRKEDVPNNGV